MCSQVMVCPTIFASSSSDSDLQIRVARLAIFIQWALRQSKSSHYSADQAQQLRDRAQEAQRLLWELQYLAQ